LAVSVGCSRYGEGSATITGFRGPAARVLLDNRGYRRCLVNIAGVAIIRMVVLIANDGSLGHRVIVKSVESLRPTLVVAIIVNAAAMTEGPPAIVIALGIGSHLVCRDRRSWGQDGGGLTAARAVLAALSDDVEGRHAVSGVEMIDAGDCLIVRPARSG
jgi:hypothetical protein